MAKHLALMENTPRGYEVRQYFINAEKSLMNVVDIMATKDPEKILEYALRIKSIVGKI